jgi:phage tail sheath protein FI
MTGSYKTVSLYQGLRDVMQKSTININPIATFPGVGLVNFGQKTRHMSSALDRINVSRLVAYIRYQLGIITKPFLFEPNDAQTRASIKGVVDSFLLELTGTRALYDFITVCDTTNNTSTRIDRNELWVDVAIEPVKAVEFIYIPLRILNTGSIKAGNYGNISTGSGS